jgi:hypothetical protein
MLGSVQREGENNVMYLDIENKTQEPLFNFAIKIDANSYKIQAPTVAVALQGVIFLLQSSTQVLLPEQLFH